MSATGLFERADRRQGSQLGDVGTRRLRDVLTSQCAGRRTKAKRSSIASNVDLSASAIARAQPGPGLAAAYQPFHLVSIRRLRTMRIAIMQLLMLCSVHDSPETLTAHPGEATHSGVRTTAQCLGHPAQASRGFASTRAVIVV
jgi:hypothetical protein